MEAALRNRWALGSCCVGTVLTLPDVALAELSAGAFDFVWIDLEHGALGALDVPPLAIAAARQRGKSRSRARCGDRRDRPGLDAGVDGIVVCASTTRVS